MAFNEVYEMIFELSNEEIQKNYQNILAQETISKIIEAHDHLEDLLSFINEHGAPTWVVDSTTSHAEWFLRVYKRGTSDIEPHIKKLLQGLFFNIGGLSEGQAQYPTLPVLLSWVNSQIALNVDLDNRVSAIVSEQAKLNIGETEKSYLAALKELRTMKEDAEKTIASLQKASGGIAVEKYAEIFESQAKTHSSEFVLRVENQSLRWRILNGKAQRWLVVGMLSCILLVVTMFRIDSFVKIEGLTWTPGNVVHLLSRSILISLNLFLISFSFKQYRINKHLHTLNQHRANTLKSFEYLTKAPDKLDASSYNAILMKVAESIYDAGHTGYISVHEGSADMPSIIDMTKVITSNKAD
jgi:hypothetical protein